MYGGFLFGFNIICWAAFELGFECGMQFIRKQYMRLQPLSGCVHLGGCNAETQQSNQILVKFTVCSAVTNESTVELH